MTRARVATFNVRHGKGTDNRIDLERVAATIIGTGADLVALQELDRGMERTEGVDQPEILQRLTGLPVVFRRIVRIRGGDYGIALAGRGLERMSFRRLPRLGDESPRALLGATWQGIRVMSTHLATEPAPREAQTRFLADRARKARGPTIVMGDLNQEHHSLGALVAAGLDPGPGHHPTFGRIHKRQIDFIFGKRGARVLRSWTIPSAASDHVPLVAEIEIGAPDQSQGKAAGLRDGYVI